MVAYNPPDTVLLMIGAVHRGPPLLAAGRRLVPLAKQDRAKLLPLGFESDFDEELDEMLYDLEKYLKDPGIRKNDTPLQMAETAEAMAEIRRWLVELREIAILDLSLDAPAVMAVFSPAPEVVDGYPRDALDELEKRIAAAKDMRPRLEDIGVDEKFVARGKRLAHQLRTAIGKQDLDAANLQLKNRRHYMKKASIYILAKRVARAGRYVFRRQPQRARLYHSREIDSPQS